MNFSELGMSLEMGLIYGIIAMGIYLSFRVIDFPDLTCDGSFVLGAAASCVLVKAGYSPFLGLIVALLAGSASGLTTGLLNTCLKISNLLSGILVAFMLYSINLKVMQGMPNIALINETTVFTGVNPILLLVLICLVMGGIIGYLLNTHFGLALRSIGQNKSLAKNGGVSVKRMTVIGLMLSNALIALGGALFSQHQGFADVGSGIGTVIIGFASVMIGERLFPSRSAWIQVFSCLMGSILYRIFISLALHSEVLGLETQDLNMITGLMIVIVMCLPRRQVC